MIPQPAMRSNRECREGLRFLATPDGTGQWKAVQFREEFALKLANFSVSVDYCLMIFLFLNKRCVIRFPCCRFGNEFGC